MNTIKIKLISETEKIANNLLLSAFETIFCANNYNKMKVFLHVDGCFFGRLNRDKACGYFYNLFFDEIGISKKNQIYSLKGISIDNIPGEIVLEMRCSDFGSFNADCSITKKQFGDQPDIKQNELVCRFAFSFKDCAIYSIRIPGKCIGEFEKLIKNN
jgi:hypothetical protein